MYFTTNCDCKKKLGELKSKIKSLKEVYQKIFSSYAPSMFSYRTHVEIIPTYIKDINSSEHWGPNKFVYEKETLAVKHCYERSITLINYRNKIKKRKWENKTFKMLNNCSNNFNSAIKQKETVCKKIRLRNSMDGNNTEDMTEKKFQSEENATDDVSVICEFDGNVPFSIKGNKKNFTNEQRIEICNLNIKANDLSQFANKHLFKENLTMLESSEEDEILIEDTVNCITEKIKLQSKCAETKKDMILLKNNNQLIKSNRYLVEKIKTIADNPEIIHIERGKLDSERVSKISKHDNILSNKKNTSSCKFVLCDSDFQQEHDKSLIPCENLSLSNLSNKRKFKNEGLNSFDNLENNDDSLEDECVFVEKDVPLWDFTEEPVNFTVPLLHMRETSEILSKEEIRSLESKEDIKVWKHTWSKEENNLLKRNYEDFIAQFGINDPNLLLGIGRRVSINKSEFVNVKKFLKAKHFLLRLGKDINNRTLSQIYKKARWMFNPIKKTLNIRHKSILLKLQNKYGNKWQLISQKCGLSPEICKYNYQKFQNSSKSGTWSKGELRNLLNAIKTVTGNPELRFPKPRSIPFEKVAKLVSTRNAYQCRSKWYAYEVDKLYKWEEKHISKLLFLLKTEFYVSNRLDIKWEQVYQHFKNVIPYCCLLKRKWKNLRYYHVPASLRKNHVNSLNYLYNSYKNKMVNMYTEETILD